MNATNSTLSTDNGDRTSDSVGGSSEKTPLLNVTGLAGGYGMVEVLFGLDLVVYPNETVVVLGANGAGKTTTLRAISGMIPVTAGEVVFDGTPVTGRRPDELLRMGIAHVPQGRGTINDLTVDENLRIGAFARKDDISADLDHWYERFPRLHERRTQLAGSMSGGEQQMLAIARALMSRPRLLLLDEPSMGLAPLVVEDVFNQLRHITTESSTSVLLVEQNANLALQFASRAYLLEAGHIVAEGAASDLQDDPAIQKAYLGL